MALIPKIDLSISNTCDTINVYEETGPYVLATNPGGWVNSGVVAANIDTSEITSSILTIYDYTGVTLQHTIILLDGSTDVYTGVTGAPAPGSFLAVLETPWSLADGIYKIVYTVTDGITEFTNATQHKLFTCGIENCMDKIRGYIVTECNAKTLAKQKAMINQLELLMYGINSAYANADFVTATGLIANGKLICDNICDCGCGDC